MWRGIHPTESAHSGMAVRSTVGRAGSPRSTFGLNGSEPRDPRTASGQAASRARAKPEAIPFRSLDHEAPSNSSMCPGPSVSDFLATVTVKVCGDCNSKWMNRLENTAQQLLRPVFEGSTVTLSLDDQARSATWAVKSLLAYSRATLARQVDPFPPSELRRLSKGATNPSPRWRVWIGWCP